MKLSEYELKLLGKDAKNSDISKKDVKRLKMAYDIALDTRKFEIELYWKRTTYFWGFCTVFLGATILSDKLLITNSIIDIKIYIFLLVLTFTGALVTFCWYVANRGSKFWQENWESIICELSSRFSGKIFDIHPKMNNYKGFDNKKTKSQNFGFKYLLSASPKSVSKANNGITLIFFILWNIFILYYTVLSIISEIGAGDNYWLLIIVNVILIVVYIYSLILVWVKTATKHINGEYKPFGDNRVMNKVFRIN